MLDDFGKPGARMVSLPVPVKDHGHRTHPMQTHPSDLDARLVDDDPALGDKGR